MDERALADRKFRALLESAPDSIVIVDRQGRIAIVNQQVEQMFGYRRDELIGQPVEILIPERFHEGHVGDRTRYVAHPRTRPMGAGLQLFARRKDGTEFPVEISLSPLEEPDGTLVTSIVRDVSDRKRAEEQLRQAAAELASSNADLEQFAYVASHDLQEPLRMVASYTQLLARRYAGKLDHDADEFIGFAVDGAKRMQDLINDLLAYSRVGTRPLQLQSVDLGQLVDQLIVDLAITIEEDDARVTHDELPTLQA